MYSLGPCFRVNVISVSSFTGKLKVGLIDKEFVSVKLLSIFLAFKWQKSSG